MKNFEQERGVFITNVAQFVTHDMLFNLFSLYGNIERIDKNSGLGIAGVIYQASNQMNMALKNLNQVQWLYLKPHKALNVFFSFSANYGTFLPYF